jgi:hypothetical protein
MSLDSSRTISSLVFFELIKNKKINKNKN